MSTSAESVGDAVYLTDKSVIRVLFFVCLVRVRFYR